MIFLLGRELLPMLGGRRFLGLFVGANVLGGLAWSLVHWSTGGVHLGAMAAASAMMVVFACFFPNRRLDFLLLFLPVSLKPKYLAWAGLGLALTGLVFFETRPVEPPFGRFAIASSAHLGGMLAGWIYYRFVHDAPWRRVLPWRSRRGMSDFAPAVPAIPLAEMDNPAPETREELRARVDRVLDKINSHGFGSLTPDEKRLLDEAKDLLSRR